MEWIKCSEGLPDKRTDDLSKDKGIIFANTKRTALMYVFMSITPNIPAMLQNDLEGWEWIDESVPSLTIQQGLDIWDAAQERIGFELAGEQFTSEPPDKVPYFKSIGIDIDKLK